MASPKKICQACGSSLSGRKDAKTCSSTCRKRLQRARYLLSQETAELKQVVSKAEDSLVSLEKKIVPVEVNEAGFIGDFTPETVKPAAPQNYNPPVPPLVDVPAFEAPPESDALDSKPEVIDQSPTWLPIKRPWWKRQKVSGLALSMIAMVIIFGGFSAWLLNRAHQTVVVKPAVAKLSNGLIPVDYQNKKLSINFDTTVAGGKSLTLTGPVVIQNDSDSTGVFKIQSADGNTILAADTLNKQINIGNNPPGQVSLSVKGDISTNGSLVSTTNGYSLGNAGLSLGGRLVCTANGCVPTSAGQTIDVANLAYLSANQTFSGVNNFTNTANIFVGDGSGLTNLDASKLASGTVNDLRLSNNVTLQGNSFNGASQLVQTTNLGFLPALNGSLLTNLNASAVTSGTIDDLRLAADVPLTGANNNFTGNNSFTNAITIPGYKTTNNGHAINVGFTNTSIGNVTFAFDLSVTPGTYTICTVEAGNCVGSGSGIAGNGTPGHIAKFNGAQSLADSIITDNGTTVDVAGNFNATTVTQNNNTVCDVSGNCAGVGGQVGTFGSPTAGTIALFHGSATIENSILTQSGSTVTAAGNLNLTSGNFYQVNGVQVTSAILSNDANLAKLNANQTFSGNNTFIGTTAINNTGSASTNIGASASGGTITIGNTSGTDLVLQDAQWNVTGAGAATFASITNNGTYNGNTFTNSALTFSANSGATIDANGANTISIGGTSTGDILLGGGSSSTGCTLTNSNGNFTCTGNITGAATGTAGYWSRSGTTLQPATPGDAVTTSGNISTTGSGTITSAGLLTASSGLTATGTTQINNSGSSATNIAVSGTGTLGLGNTTGATTLTGASGSSSIAFGNFAVSTAGVISLQGGQTKDITTASAGTSAALTFAPGDSTTNSGTGSSLTLRGSNQTGTTSVGGNLVLQGGTGTTTNGVVQIGTANTSAITIGATGITTTNTGSLTSTQTLTASNGLTVTTGSLALTGTSGFISLTAGASTTNVLGLTTNSLTTGNAINVAFKQNAAGGAASTASGIKIVAATATNTGNTTDLINLSSSGLTGTVNGIDFTGTNSNLTNLINSTNFTVSSAGAITAGTYNGNTFTNTRLAFSAASTATVDSASGRAIAIGDTNATGITLGNTSNTASFTLQGTAAATYTIGNTNTTGTITVGQSTDTSEIDIGNANTADTKVQTIKIGGGTGVTTGKSVVTVGSTANASSLTLQAGTGNINLSPSGSSSTGVNLKPTVADSTAAFRVQNTSSGAVFTVDTSGNNVVIGTGSTGEATPKLLILDKSTSDSQPSCTNANGAIYYNGNTTNSSIAKGIWGCVNGTWYPMANYASVTDLTSTGNNTWTPPSGITAVTVQMCGAGGGGATGGSGGGGGAFATRTFSAATLGASAISYTVGTHGGAGGDGTSTIFGSNSVTTGYLVAGGGGGGVSGQGGGGGASAGVTGAATPNGSTSTPGTPTAFGSASTAPYSGNGVGPQGAYGGVSNATLANIKQAGGAENGGAGGGPSGTDSGFGIPGSGVAGGSSINGAGGGGGGGSYDAANGAGAGGAGGKSGAYTPGGGGAANGGAGAATKGVCGTGGGGGTGNNSGTGSPGGVGKYGGGGGGGGDGSSAGGTGGNGGDGRILIICW